MCFFPRRTSHTDRTDHLENAIDQEARELLRRMRTLCAAIFLRYQQETRGRLFRYLISAPAPKNILWVLNLLQEYFATCAHVQ